MLLTFYSFFSDTLPPCPANWEGLEAGGGGRVGEGRNTTEKKSNERKIN